MDVDLVVQIVSIVVVIGMFALTLVHKKIHYAVSGLVLIAIGTLNILFMLGKIGFDINKVPVVQFAAYFIILLAGRDLLKEGIKEESSGLRYPSIVLAIILIVLTTIPTLNKFKVVSWALPSYPLILDAILYIVCGVFLIIGVFALLKD